MPDVGTLQVSLVSNRGKRPITDAAVEISSAGEPDKILEVLKTDLSGQTEVIELETPPLEYSMEPGLNQPYSEYNLKITAPGFEPVEIAGSQMLSGQLALQNLSLKPTITETASYEVLAPPCDFAFPNDGKRSEATPNTEMILVSDVDLNLLNELHIYGAVRNLRDRRKDLYDLKQKK